MKSSHCKRPFGRGFVETSDAASNAVAGLSSEDIDIAANKTAATLSSDTALARAQGGLKLHREATHHPRRDIAEKADWQAVAKPPAASRHRNR